MPDKKESEAFVCPHCKERVVNIHIIQDAYIKDNIREQFCECMDCNKCFIVKYKLIEITKLNRRDAR